MNASLWKETWRPQDLFSNLSGRSDGTAWYRYRVDIIILAGSYGSICSGEDDDHSTSFPRKPRKSGTQLLLLSSFGILSLLALLLP